jgi:exoribonuclease-2
MVFDADGVLLEGQIYRAIVCNHAKLAYNGVAAWLDGKGPLPEGVAAVDGLDANLRLQDKVAQKIKKLRHMHGALSLETIEARPMFDGEMMTGLEADAKNRAKEIIEDFMIAANGVTARYLSAQHFPTIRRVVRSPKRWARIVEIAEEYGSKLPGTPDSRALETFLIEQRAADPLRFPDLSLSIIKLIGAGEYVAERHPGTLAWPCGITCIPRHPIAGTRIWSRSVWSKPRLQENPAPIAWTNSNFSPTISRRKKMMPRKWNARWGNRRLRSFWKAALAKPSMPL